MDFSWLESLIFGFVAGLTEILPVSAQAHKALLYKLFGAGESPLLDMFVHLAALVAVYMGCKVQIGQILREQRLSQISKRRRKRQPDMRRLLELRMLQTAAVPLLLGFLAYPALAAWRTDLSKSALFLVLNGLTLYIPMHMRHGNKDARSMTRIDGFLMGVAGGLGIIPGMSRVGTATSFSVARGADKTNALNWALLLSLPALVCFIGMDFYDFVTSDLIYFSFGLLVNGVLAAGAAYAGAYIAIVFLRYLAVSLGFSGFAYYSWGAALFAFIMYLTI